MCPPPSADDTEHRAAFLAVLSLGLRVGARIAPLDSGCWHWLGSLDKDGYARIKWLGRNSLVTRALAALAWPEWFGPEMDVHHTCLNAWCVNPRHFELREWHEHRRWHKARGDDHVGNGLNWG